MSNEDSDHMIRVCMVISLALKLGAGVESAIRIRPPLLDGHILDALRRCKRNMAEADVSILLAFVKGMVKNYKFLASSLDPTEIKLLTSSGTYVMPLFEDRAAWKRFLSTY